MTPKQFCLLILAVVACAVAQSEDEFNIPVENDNQFPPEDHSEPDEGIIEGSGSSAIEVPVGDTTTITAPLIEDVQQPISAEDKELTPEFVDTSCPKSCVCHIEGNSNNFVVDCSGYELTEFPSPIDIKTTTLNIQNNKLTEIPKDISLLKNLKVLNANNNSIMELALGSISELPELTTLKLGNNRLIEFPKDLKNSFGLTNLEELDLGGNDMRTPLTQESFTNFIALKKLTLPTATTNLVEELCSAFKESLELVCSESCSTQAYECPDVSQPIDDEDMMNVLPGTIVLNTAIDNDNVDPNLLENKNTNYANTETTPENVESHDDDPESTTISPSVVVTKEKAADQNEFSLRSAVNKAEPVEVSSLSTLIEAPKDIEKHTDTDDHKVLDKETDVAVGATTSSTNTGGVDKSVIGIIVAGMVLVVAGITIKKNWSSIKKRFSSSPRAANGVVTGANTNGTTPEEVPLQEKSPV